MTALSQSNIRNLLSALNSELKKDGVVGELYLVGGAVMCLVFQARPSTKDIDAFFKPATQIRKAAARVATKAHLPEDWLNDGVKGFLSAKGNYEPFLDLSHLKVMTASAQYLLAMKCLALRIGEEFHDEDDIRYLLRNLNIRSYENALAVISKYYPLEKFPQKTLYALEEILSQHS
jgi:hypothetical protein